MEEEVGTFFSRTIPHYDLSGNYYYCKIGYLIKLIRRVHIEFLQRWIKMENFTFRKAHDAKYVLYALFDSQLPRKKLRVIVDAFGDMMNLMGIFAIFFSDEKIRLKIKTESEPDDRYFILIDAERYLSYEPVRVEIATYRLTYFDRRKKT